jgi:hypothetical protein
MNNFKFKCSHCQQSLEAPDDMYGQKINCPACNVAIVIPTPALEPNPIIPPPLPTKAQPITVEISSDKHHPFKISADSAAGAIDANTASIRKTSTLAIWSIVLGSLSLCGLALLTGIPAIICGHIARKRIQQNSTEYEGRGLALAGLIMGYIGTVVVAVILAIVASLYFSLQALQTKTVIAHKAATRTSVQCISLAIDTYEVDNGFFPRTLKNLTVISGEPHWNGPYLMHGQIPKDSWNNDFQYSEREFV